MAALFFSRSLLWQPAEHHSLNLRSLDGPATTAPRWAILNQARIALCANQGSSTLLLRLGGTERIFIYLPVLVAGFWFEREEDAPSGEYPDGLATIWSRGR